MTAPDERRIRLAEARLAVQQCCGLLGQDRTDRIVAEINAAEAELT
jgi:hypothetical protein